MKTEKEHSIKNLLSKEHKHMLWKDECQEPHYFLLLKYAEVYKHSSKVLRLHIWSKKMLSLLQKRGVILNELHVNERFHVIDVSVTNLGLIISLGAFSRRPNRKGAWVKHKEKLLAHKIISCRVKLARKKIKNRLGSYLRVVATAS